LNQCGSNNLQGANKVLRRTVTIDDENHHDMNQLRAWFLTEKLKDLDFTSTVNMLLNLGLNRFRGKDLDDEEYDIINKYVFGFSELKTESLSDEHWNQWLEYQYPKMIKQLQQIEKKSTSIGVKGKKKE